MHHTISDDGILANGRVSFDKCDFSAFDYWIDADRGEHDINQLQVRLDNHGTRRIHEFPLYLTDIQTTFISPSVMG